MKSDPTVPVEHFANQLLTLYKIRTNQLYAKSFIRIYRTDKIERVNARSKKVKSTQVVKTFNRVTDHTKHPYNLLTKHKYTHEEIEQFIQVHGISPRSTELHDLLYYHFDSHETTIQNIHITIKTMTKISKDALQIKLFEKNN